MADSARPAGLGVRVIIDTDTGTDPDDALAFALASPEIDLVGVTVATGDVAGRVRIAARLLGMAGRDDPPDGGQGVDCWAY